MEFDASLMDLSIRHPDPTLLKTLQEQAEKQHQELQRCDPVVIQVRSTLQAMMERTIPLRERVASQLGMLAGTAIYVNAGRELGQLESLSGILSPGLIASFIALGLFPLIAKKIVGVLRKRNASEPSVS